jgi:probable rRNA maturation factor
MPDSVARVAVDVALGSGVSRSEIERRLKRMIDALKITDSEVSVLLTGDAQIQELNRLYRKKDRPTDVLAFAMSEGQKNPRILAKNLPRLLGDVIVSIPTARRQAKAAERLVLDEVTMLLAHGLLHLLGWDHATDATDRAMRAETDRLCAAARTKRRSLQRPERRARKLS